MPTPILATKLYIPPPRPALVPRPRLIEWLNEGLTQKLILISAPAGFGKTTLVSSWLHHLAGQQRAGEKNSPLLPGFSVPLRFIWLSLDEADNDPAHFLTYLIAALQQVEANIGQTALDMLRARGAQPSPFPSLLTLLINDLASVETRVILVLDDYHFIEAKPIHQAITFLLDHLPPLLHLVITSRTDPSDLPLSRLRGRGQLVELRATDLRFTFEETAAFLQQTLDLNLSAEEIATLEMRTEGWITGLQLAALSIRGHQDKSDFIANFTGKDRHVVDYLLEEVFRGQPEQTQNFLLQTSILSRLTGPLCDIVTGQNNGQEILERLEKTNLFIVPLDNERQWYRYQQLFGEFLRGRSQQQQAEMLPDRHLRAARWFMANGWLDEAIVHTLRAGAFEQAAALIEQAVDTTLRLRGEAITFLAWLEALPNPIVYSRPRLCLAQAWAFFNTGQWPQAEPLLQQIEHSLVSASSDLAAAPTTAGELGEIQGEMAALRAELALFQENTGQALALSAQALAYLPQENLLLRSMATQVQGFTYRLQGEVTKASQILAEASVLGQAAGNLTFAIFALSDLAEVQVMQGQLRQAAGTYQQIMNLASQHRAWPFPPTGTAYIGMGNVLREWNELDTAIQHLHKGLELSQQGGYIGVVSQGYLILAQIKQAQGEVGQAFDLLRQVDKLVGQTKSRRLRARVQMTRAWLGLKQGEVTAAARWALEYEQNESGQRSSPVYQRQLEQTTLARIHLAQGQPDLAKLERLLQTAESAGWQQNVLELLVLQALAFETQGDTPRAITTLKRALTLAEPEGYIRLFIDEGAPLAKLLHLVSAQRIMPAYAGQLQASFMPAVSEKHISPQALIDPLTERELNVLQLMATGLSNQEIADELVLALGTVARYTNNIFTKLNVRNRTQAISRAQLLGLI